MGEFYTFKTVLTYILKEEWSIKEYEIWGNNHNTISNLLGENADISPACIAFSRFIIKFFTYQKRRSFDTDLGQKFSELHNFLDKYFPGTDVRISAENDHAGMQEMFRQADKSFMISQHLSCYIDHFFSLDTC